jgi:hypothetical protein
MVNDITKDPEKLLTRIEYLEDNRRFVQNMLEMAISLVDFQENIVSSFGPENIAHPVPDPLRSECPVPGRPGQFGPPAGGLQPAQGAGVHDRRGRGVDRKGVLRLGHP